MERSSKKEFITDVLYVALVSFLVLAAAYVVFKFLFPFVIGAIIAYVVQMPAAWVGKKIRVSRGYIAAVISVLVYGVVVAVLIFLIYRAALFAVGFTDFLPSLTEKMKDIFEEFSDKFSSYFQFLEDRFDIDFSSLLVGTLQKIGDKSMMLITDTIAAAIKKIPLYFVSAAVTLVATCFIAKDYEKLKKFVKILMGKALSQKLIKVKNIFFGSVLRLFRGYLILVGLTLIQLYLGFLVLGISNPFTLALIISLVDILPVLGTGTILIPWAVLSVLTGDYKTGIGIAVTFAVITLVRNFSEPKIIGKQIGINPLFTLVAMFLGLKVLGVWGLVLFPIILIVVIRYYKEDMQEGLSE